MKSSKILKKKKNYKKMLKCFLIKQKNLFLFIREALLAQSLEKNRIENGIDKVQNILTTGKCGKN